jgi:diguanylate cyclase (GGDEF)-like protein
MRILIALEDAESARSIESKLALEGYEVVLAGDGSEAWLALQKDGAPKIALLGRNLAKMDGLKVCREARKHEEMSYIYIVLVTDAKTKEKDIAEGSTAGADDFILRPFDDGELKVRLRAGRRILGLQEDLKTSQEALSYQASHDPLTGLWNRAAILDVLRRELARVRREKTPVGIIAVQVDEFKEINDKYGSMAGDAVLRGTARKMRAAVRPYDSIGRFGSESFLIVAPGSDPQSAHGQAERLRAAVASEPVDITEWGKNIAPDKAKLAVTVSLGVVTSSTMQEVELLVKTAETAVARARKQGANRVEVATEQKPAS